jgi:hypothetical protein
MPAETLGITSMGVRGTEAAKQIQNPHGTNQSRDDLASFEQPVDGREALPMIA